jgi:hypothetical protein
MARPQTLCFGSINMNYPIDISLVACAANFSALLQRTLPARACSGNCANQERARITHLSPDDPRHVRPRMGFRLCAVVISPSRVIASPHSRNRKHTLFPEGCLVSQLPRKMRVATHDQTWPPFGGECGSPSVPAQARSFGTAGDRRKRLCNQALVGMAGHPSRGPGETATALRRQGAVGPGCPGSRKAPSGNPGVCPPPSLAIELPRHQAGKAMGTPAVGAATSGS